jgi:hypothetical protein
MGGLAVQGGATVKLKITVAALIATAALLTPRLHAQTLEITSLPAGIPGPATESQVLPLDLITAYEMAMSRNLDLQVGRFSIASADASIHSASGVFDPNLGASLGGDWMRTPSTTVLEGSLVPEYRNTRFGIGIDGLLPTGTVWSADLGTTRFETNSTFYFLNPNWNSDLNLAVTQPLMRGFGTLVTRSGIVVARNSRAQTVEAFETLKRDGKIRNWGVSNLDAGDMDELAGVPGGINSGFNRLENHDKLVAFFEETAPKVAAAGFKNIICFSGNRKGQSD